MKLLRMVVGIGLILLVTSDAALPMFSRAGCLFNNFSKKSPGAPRVSESIFQKISFDAKKESGGLRECSKESKNLFSKNNSHFYCPNHSQKRWFRATFDPELINRARVRKEQTYLLAQWYGCDDQEVENAIHAQHKQVVREYLETEELHHRLADRLKVSYQDIPQILEQEGLIDFLAHHGATYMLCVKNVIDQVAAEWEQDKTRNIFRYINRQDEEGKTALFWAVVYEHYVAVEVLLDMGADPNIPSLDGIRPLEYAQILNNKPLIDMLCKAGAQA